MLATLHGCSAKSLRLLPAPRPSLKIRCRRHYCRPINATAEVPEAKTTGAASPRQPAEAPTVASTVVPPVKQVDQEWMKEVVEELKDTSKFGTRGEAWFAAQLVGILLVVFPPAGLQGIVDACGWLLVATGLGMMVAGQQALGQNLTPLPKPRDSNLLVTDGIYKYCRHPMYGGLIVAASGLTLATGNEVRLAMTLLLAAVLSEKANYEERLLTEAHPEYVEYQKATKKLIPYLF